MHTPVLLSSLLFPPMDENLHDNVIKGLLNIVHSDVWRPTQTATFGGCRYYVLFIDDFSRHSWIYPMRNKSEVFGHFQKF